MRLEKAREREGKGGETGDGRTVDAISKFATSQRYQVHFPECRKLLARFYTTGTRQSRHVVGAQRRRASRGGCIACPAIVPKTSATADFKFIVRWG